MSFAGSASGKSKSIFAAKIDEIIGLMPLVGSCTARLATWKLSFHEPVEVPSNRKA
jgi:hypothetical protein